MDDGCSKISFSALLIRLNEWFCSTARILPWRSEPTPYKVWISEIMLQQTVVASVIPFFNRFIEHFPDVHALASARIEDVLQLWSGLGYYSRARNLHRAALILDKSGFPETRSEWENLPGVGPYTAGAVLSIAWNRPEAILDGNIERVWSRFRCISREGKYKEHLWDLSRLAIKESVRSGLHPSVINQALMELGALVCRPSVPSCKDCPLSLRCLSFSRECQHEYPQKNRKISYTQIRETVYVYCLSDGRVYLPLSPSSRWRKGMRDFPVTEKPEWCAAVRRARSVITKHIVTRYKITRSAEIYLFNDDAVISAADRMDFFSGLTQIPHSAACRKTWDAVFGTDKR